MEIVEEVHRARQEIEVKRPDSALKEFKDLLEHEFSHVEEEKHVKKPDEETGRFVTERHMDQFTHEELEIFISVNYSEAEISLQIKGKLLTHYPEDYIHQKTVWYYAYRTLYDKFLYGNAREGFIPNVEEKTEELLKKTRQRLEA